MKYVPKLKLAIHLGKQKEITFKKAKILFCLHMKKNQSPPFNSSLN